MNYKHPIVNAHKIVSKAARKKQAAGHFNAMNLLYIKAIIAAANELKTPLIIAVTEAKLDWLGGLKNFLDQVKNVLASYHDPIEIAVHLDHAQNLENCFKAIDAGFSSVMYDGSKLPIEKNIANLKKLLPYAKQHQVSIEAEIGAVGGVEDGMIGSGVSASVADAQKMQPVAIQLLAAAVGNIHGKYPPGWKQLNFQLIPQLQKSSQKLLVLHGASGIPAPQIKKAIKLGIAKINVSSELHWVFASALKTYFQSKFKPNSNWEDPRAIFAKPYAAVKALVKAKLKLFTT